MNRVAVGLAAAGLLAVSVTAQTEKTVEQVDTTQAQSPVDQPHLTVHQMLSFGMGASSAHDLWSQGLYTTMMTYRFAKPVTLQMNFGLPIYSSYSQSSNPTWDNLHSLDYFKSMPFDIALTWQPSVNSSLSLSITKCTPEQYYLWHYGDPGVFNTLTGSWMH